MACEDPSNVGLGVIGAGENEPTRVFLSGADLPSERDAPVTGGLRSGVTFSGPARYLVGIADDPVFGLIEANGYVDFTIPITVGNNFRAGTVTAVSLHFETDGYVYGDTLASTTITVSDLTEPWTAFGARSDTTFVVGDSIMSVAYDFGQSNVVFNMPADWVSANGAVLIDLNFIDLFHGFELSATSPAAVTGFAGLPGFMRVTTTTGTAEYPLSKLVTTLSKEPAAPIVGRTAIQDGFGDNAVLDFEFEIDSIAGSAVSRAVVDIRVDMSIFESPAPNFVRPIPTSLSLIGLRDDGTRRVLLQSSVRDEGRVSFVSSSATIGEFTLVRSVQLAVTGRTDFVKYAISIVEAQASIGSALIYNASSLEDGPEAVITITPTPFTE
ncbi:hypothetical protein ACFLRO_00245 [Bacteroidota bacterium]